MGGSGSGVLMKLQSSCWLGLQSLESWVGWKFYIQNSVYTWLLAWGLSSSELVGFSIGALRVLSVWQLDKWLISEREQEGSYSVFQRAGLEISTIRLCNASFVLLIGNNLLTTLVKERGIQLHSLKGGLSKNLWAWFKITVISHFITPWLSCTPDWFTGSALGKGMKSGKNASIPSLWVSKVIACSWVVVIGEWQPKGIHLLQRATEEIISERESWTPSIIFLRVALQRQIASIIIITTVAFELTNFVYFPSWEQETCLEESLLWKYRQCAPPSQCL